MKSSAGPVVQNGDLQEERRRDASSGLIRTVSGNGAPDWKRIALVTGTVGIFAIAVGLVSPLLALILESQGHSSSLIGANAAMMPFGLVVSALFAPRVTQAIGAYRAAILYALIGAGTLTLIGAIQNIWFWFPGRFLVGLAIGGFYIVNKAWLNEIALPRFRGRIMGAYTAILAAGFSLGPVALALTGSRGPTPFAVGIAAFAAAAMLVVAFGRRLPKFSVKDRASILSFLPHAPLLLVAVGMFGLFDHATLAFLPAFGLQSGLNEATMAFGLAVLNAGSIFLQMPIGLLADRFPRRIVLVGCAAMTVVGALLLPLAVQTPSLLWALLFIWGAGAYGVTTVSLAELGDRFSGATLLAGSAAFTLASGIGGMTGGPLAGGAIDVLGYGGLPVALAAAFALLILLASIFPLTNSTFPLTNSTGRDHCSPAKLAAADRIAATQRPGAS
jgi:MFS family permease